MRTASLLAVTLSALAAAESTTTVGYLGVNNGLGDDIGPFWFTSTAASVAGINAEATTYEIRCLSGAPSSDCQIESKHPWTLIQGPATYNFDASFTYSSDHTTATYTETADCSMSQYSTSVSCSWSVSATGSSSGGNLASSTSSSSSNIATASITYWELEVTGGVASFTAPEATKTAGAAVGPAKPLITAAPLAAAAAAAVAAMF
ncbi:hypothetical protein N7520_003247 [Penicillium odoratum]|uniref:uncharacterized protein n=1 Tax=Penicillium odoratum TaxID=1167516 RepID=UPI002547F0D9|nr:uncharacterized protein N7520_003247 [Penicillium odoratum]KAJ5772718.1 hypothetical protein N7520_003247 [Penicillium odoratum]